MSISFPGPIPVFSKTKSTISLSRHGPWDTKRQKPSRGEAPNPPSLWKEDFVAQRITGPLRSECVGPALWDQWGPTHELKSGRSVIQKREFTKLTAQGTRRRSPKNRTSLSASLRRRSDPTLFVAAARDASHAQALASRPSRTGAPLEPAAAPTRRARDLGVQDCLGPTAESQHNTVFSDGKWKGLLLRALDNLPSKSVRLYWSLQRISVLVSCAFSVRLKILVIHQLFTSTVRSSGDPGRTKTSRPIKVSAARDSKVDQVGRPEDNRSVSCTETPYTTLGSHPN